MRLLRRIAVAATIFGTNFVFAIEPPVTGCIDVLAGQRRIAEWIAGCEFKAETHTAVLERIVQRVRAAKARGETPVVVLDLDSTLYDTGPRALGALRAVLQEHPEWFPEAIKAKLEAIERFQWFSVPEAFEAIGLSMKDPANGAVWNTMASCWFHHYRSKEMVALDTLYRGAGEFVRKLHDEGAHIAYVTGRQKILMEASTIEALGRDGLPFGGATRTSLFMKTPEFRRDIEFKLSTVEHVRALGTVVATVDNEPGNVLTFAEAFPDAENVFVDTVASDKPQTPRRGLARITRWD